MSWTWESALPMEIMENILLKLPVKSLIRLKCVCKGWFSIISDPYFVRTHLHQPQTQARSRLCIIEDNELDDFNTMEVRVFTGDCEEIIDDTTGWSTLSSTFDYIYFIRNFKHEVVLLDSCDGLLCIVDFYGKIVLWNPSTRQHYQLPPNPDIWDPSGCWGFGYDSSSHDYKVVVIVTTFGNDQYKTEVNVFSLKSNKWKRIQEKHHTAVKERQATILHGAAHWMAYSKSYNHLIYRIVAFDLEKEQFREMAIPSNDDFKLRVVGGCLCLHSNYDPSKMWIMKEYGIHRSWTKITSPWAIIRNNMNEEFECELLHSLNDEHLLWVWVSSGKLTLFDQKQNIYKNLHEEYVWGLDDANLYVETLVSPHPSTTLEVIKEE